MNESEKNRRNFLKKMLAVTVLSTTCPHIAIGKIEPVITKKGDKQQGTMKISLNDYPGLKQIWGFIRIDVPNTDGFFPHVLIIRLPKDEYENEFVCLNELCPHEGWIVDDPHPVTHQIRCPNHGTMFMPDGRYLSGPAAQDLTHYDVQCDGGDTLILSIPAIKNAINESGTNDLFYMKQNIPNPSFDSTMIEYGIEKPAHVKIILTDTTGKIVNELLNDMVDYGHYTLNMDTSGLSSGTYFYQMIINGRKVITRKMTVRK